MYYRISKNEKNLFFWKKIAQVWAVTLILIQNICCGYSKEPSQWDGPFEHPKHIFNIGEKKNMLWVQKRTISLRRFFWAPKKTHAWYWQEKSYQIYAYKIIRTMDYSGTLEA